MGSIDLYGCDFDGQADMVVSIMEEGDRFSAIVGRDQSLETLHVGREEVIRLNASLNKAAEALVLDLQAGGVTRDALSALLTRADRGLASRGHAVLNVIFGDFLDRMPPSDDDALPVLEIRSDSFLLPWELMYDQSPGELEGAGLGAVVKPFWGFNKVIARQSFRNKPRPGLRRRVIRRPPTIGLVVNEDLKFARAERQWLRELRDQGSIVLREFELQDGWSDYQFIKAMGGFLGAGDVDIFHFACHGNVDVEDSLASCLTIGPRYHYLISYFDMTPRVSMHEPLVFLNACSTGVRFPSHTFDFVRKFWERGAGNVVAIESAVKSRVAESFARNFYSELLSGSPLGKSVGVARRRTIMQGADVADIVALFYSLYADPGFRILNDEEVGQ